MTKVDRRVQRTRELLQNALIDLISERGYEATTIQDIVDRAHVGRTTFYLHYGNKDELFISCHEVIVSTFRFGPHARLTRAELLAREAPPGMDLAYHHLGEARARLSPMFQGKDSPFLLQRMQDWCAKDIESTLRAAFDEAGSTLPLDILATSLAGAQMGLMHWWVQKRRSHTPEDVARSFHLLRRAAIRDAFGVSEDE